jgi:hypothetical protein
VNEGDFAGLIFREKSLHVRDRQKSSNHLLLFEKARDVHRLMYESQMDAGFITTDGGVERRLAVEEVDCKSDGWQNMQERNSTVVPLSLVR